MAGWRDNLIPASFRGVPFFVEGHNTTGGRNGPTHEFPGRDDPYHEDTGRKADTFRIRAYVIGDDYFDQRDALLKALKAEGPGPLSHPYLGRFSAVAATDYDLSEEKDQGRIARFNITFVEAGENLFPAAAADRRQAVTDAADACDAAAIDDFEDEFLTDDQIAFVEEDSRTVVERFVDDLLARTKEIRADVASAWDVVTRINAAINKVGTLVRFPFDLAVQIQDLIGGFAGLIPAGIFALRPLLDLAGWGDDASDVSASVTASRRQLATNRDAVIRLVRRQAAGQAARTLAGLAAAGAFVSLEATLAARDEVIAVLDAEIDIAGETGAHDVFVALSTLRTETIRFANEEAARLPRLQSFTPAATLPAAVIAWRLYGDASRAGEIASRNGVRHPGFVPGGQALEVLNG